MDQFNISKNLKKRIYTSFILLTLLILMLIDNFVYGYFLIVIGILSILEFFKMILIIKKDKIIQFSYNLIFIIYISCLTGACLIFSSLFTLKLITFIILIICISSDIGGYIFGKVFKGPKLSKLSPKKTISGSLGSLMFSSATAFFLIYNLNGGMEYKNILVGCIISIACQLGDLFFSFIKRKSNLKDTSDILPGHGGILDRIDGILLGLPVGFLTLLIFY